MKDGILRPNATTFVEEAKETLTVQSSLNAAGFYERQGVDTLDEDVTEFGKTHEIRCVNMKKER